MPSNECNIMYDDCVSCCLRCCDTPHCDTCGWPDTRRHNGHHGCWHNVQWIATGHIHYILPHRPPGLLYPHPTTAVLINTQCIWSSSAVAVQSGSAYIMHWMCTAKLKVIGIMETKSGQIQRHGDVFIPSCIQRVKQEAHEWWSRVRFQPLSPNEMFVDY